MSTPADFLALLRSQKIYERLLRRIRKRIARSMAPPCHNYFATNAATRGTRPGLGFDETLAARVAGFG